MEQSFVSDTGRKRKSYRAYLFHDAAVTPRSSERRLRNLEEEVPGVDSLGIDLYRTAKEQPAGCELSSESEPECFQSDDGNSSYEASEEDDDLSPGVDTFDKVLRFLKICRKHKMSRIQQDEMLKFFKHIHQDLSDFPGNLYYLDTFLEPHLIGYDIHHFCAKHGNYIGEEKTLINPIKCTSESCGSTHMSTKENKAKGAVFYTFPIRATINRYLKSYNGGEAFSYRMNRELGKLDVMDGKAYQNLGVSDDDISITYHVDDGQVFGMNGSPNGSLTVISYLINELPTRKRYRDRFIFALAVGTVKPNVQLMFDVFTRELAEAGSTQELFPELRILPAILTADAPARADAVDHGSLLGQFGCTGCMHEGKVVDGVRVWPNFGEAPKKDRVTYVKNARKAWTTRVVSFGVMGAAKLLRIEYFDPSIHCPPDILHAIGLGSVKRLFQYWIADSMSCLPIYEIMTDNKRKILPPHLQLEVDLRITRFRFHSCFKRTIPPVSKYSSFHGIEDLNFLLYGAFYALDGQLPDVLYQNLLDLIMAVHLLLVDHSTLLGGLEAHAEHARHLIARFSQRFQILYGERRMLFNIHQLVHFPEAIQNWGPAYHFSTFCFEDFLGTLMRSVHGSTDIASQVIRNYRHVELSRLHQKSAANSNEERAILFQPVGRPKIQADVNCDIRKQIDEIPEKINGTDCVYYSKIVRNDGLELECTGTSRKTKRCNYFFELNCGTVVKLITFIEFDSTPRRMYAAAEIFDARPFEALKLVDGTYFPFIRKCVQRDVQYRVFDVLHIFRPLVVVCEHADKPVFVVSVPNEQYIL